jgi:antitoxin (DNA-binding transcriptional repressor) of toxin-antitoxin stability system
MIENYPGKWKMRLYELLERDEQGDEIVMNGKNEPVAKHVLPTETPAKPERKLGSAKGRIRIMDDFDEPIEGF